MLSKVWIAFLILNPTVNFRDSHTVAHNHRPPAGDINIRCTRTLSWVQPSAEEVKQDLKRTQANSIPKTVPYIPNATFSHPCDTNLNALSNPYTPPLGPVNDNLAFLS